MALATRCPHCETVFKLDLHLLAPHDGRVRCGHCQEVFDAAHHRFELPDDPSASGLAQHASIIDDDVAVGPSTSYNPASLPAPVAPAKAAVTPKPFAPRTLDLGATVPPKRGETPAAPPLAAPPAAPRPQEDSDRTIYANPPAFSGAPAPTPSSPPRDEPTESAKPAGVAANEPSTLPPEAPRAKQFIRMGTPHIEGTTSARTSFPPSAEPPVPPVPPFEAEPAPFVDPVGDRAEPFIGPAQRPAEPPPARRAPPSPPIAWADDEPAFGGRPSGGAHPRSANEAFPAVREARVPERPKTGRRIIGGLFALLLALLLLAQVAWWQRETVMVYLPGSHALYSDICDELGCTISPPRDIDGLQIESSGLRQVDGPHKLELKLSLRNRTDVALAYPALELTLLDDKNNVAIRRVLWPQDYARPGTIFAIGLPPQSAQPVVVRLDTGDAVAANYRVQVFYP